VNTRELIRIEALPAYQNKMFPSREQALRCPTGDMTLIQDLDSGLVFNAAYDPQKLSYDETYQNEQGFSLAFRKHLDDVLQRIDALFGGGSVLEVGCGKGAFVAMLRARGHDAMGIDPAYEGDADYIRKLHFDSSLGLRADAIVLRHVLEHIPEPEHFLRQIADANGGRGKIYIEVPCLDWIIDNRAWFDVFYEHVNYFRLSDFPRMFGRVFESGRLFGGQYLYVFADLASLRPARAAGAPSPVAFPTDFFQALDHLSAIAAPAAGRAVWGAAAKGVMFAHHMSARGAAPDFAIDINPAKQGMFLATSGLEVLSPEKGLARLPAGADVFVMNSNYIEEISAFGGNRLNYLPVDKK
jgi:SAM-dependent methyltransferase